MLVQWFVILGRLQSQPFGVTWEPGVIAATHQLVVDLSFTEVAPTSDVIPVIIKAVQRSFGQNLYLKEAGAIVVSGANVEVSSLVIDFYVISVLKQFREQ